VFCVFRFPLQVDLRAVKPEKLRLHDEIESVFSGHVLAWLRDKAEQGEKSGHDEPSGDGAGGVVEGEAEGAFLGAGHGRRGWMG
jgi:hypothetical protein